MLRHHFVGGAVQLNMDIYRINARTGTLYRTYAWNPSPLVIWRPVPCALIPEYSYEYLYYMGWVLVLCCLYAYPEPNGNNRHVKSPSLLLFCAHQRIKLRTSKQLVEVLFFCFDRRAPVPGALFPSPYIYIDTYVAVGTLASCPVYTAHIHISLLRTELSVAFLLHAL